MDYKAVGFDYMGVIAGTPGSVFDKKISDILGVNIKKFKDTYYEINKSMNKTEVSYENFWGMILIELNRQEKLQEVLDFIKTLPKKEIKPEIVGLIDQIRNSGYKVGLLSNNSTIRSKQMKNVGLDKHFDVFHVSEEKGFEKWQPQSFLNFTKELGVEPQELIFIDDYEKNLIIANKIGIKTILFENYNELVRQLETLIEIN